MTISIIIGFIWAIVLIVAILQQADGYEKGWKWFWWIVTFVLLLGWATPIFTGVHIQNNEGQYKGYVTAVEKNGAIFKGWNVYLKTDLTSSNEDRACINRDDAELIKRLQELNESKENATLEYEGVWQYKIGECPESTWMIIGIK